MALVFVGGTFYTCGQGQAVQNEAGGGRPTAVVATVAGAPVSLDTLQQEIQNQTTQMMQMNPSGAASLPAEQEAMIASRAVASNLGRAAVMSLAKKNGVEFTDDAVRAAASKELDQSIDDFRMRFMLQRQAKPGADDKEFEKEFEAAVKQQTGGRSIQELRTTVTADVNKALADKTKRENYVAGFAGPLYLEHLKARTPLTDDQVRQSFNTYTVKQILLRNQTGPTQDPKARAEKVLTELKGGLSFEEAMNRYSNEPPQPKKKVSENTITLSANQIDTDEHYQALKGLKPGQTTGTVNTPEGIAIYKVVGVKSDLPKDFDKTKAKHRDQLAERLATAELTKQIKEMTSGSNVQWSSRGFKALYELAQMNQDPAVAADPAARQAKLDTVVADARQALEKGEPWEARYAALAQFAAVNQLYNAPTADKAKLRDQRIQAIETVLKDREDFRLRLDLVDMYADKKDANAAFQNLLMAAQTNNDYSMIGESQFQEVGTRILKLKTAGVLNAQMEEQINKEQARWTTQNAQADKAEAEAKQKAAQQQKEAEAAAKAAEAAAKKANPGATTTPPTTTGGPSTPTTTGATAPPATTGTATAGATGTGR
jgi:hypothetical protein